MRIEVLLYHNGDEQSKEVIYYGDSKNVNTVKITMNQLEYGEPFVVESEKGFKQVRVCQTESSGNERKYSLVPVGMDNKDIKILYSV